MKQDEPIKFDVAHAAGADSPAVVSMRFWAVGILRHRAIVVFFAVLATAIGGVYLLRKTPSYTAKALLVLENTRLEVGRQELLPETGIVDASTVDSQVEILRSEAISLKVIQALRLAPPASAAGDGRPGLTDEIAFLPVFQGRMAIRRIGLSSVIEVAYRADAAEQAAQVVNELTRAYLADQAAAAAAAASTASAWLRDRIKDLGAKTRVISAAHPPAHPDGPRRLLILAAFSAFGTMLGVSAALLRNALDGSLWDPDQASLRLGGRFIGAVLKAPHSASKNHFRSDCLAVVRRVHAGLLSKRTGPVIGVAGVLPGDGATAIALGLARAAAGEGRRVLLIDGNPFHPELSVRFAPNAGVGLLDFTAGAEAANEAWFGYATDTPGLDVMAIGGAAAARRGPDGGRRRDLGRECSQYYDVVFVDLPPLAAVPDFGPAGSVVEMVLLVVGWAQTPGRLAESALRNAGLRSSGLMGFVFNNVQRSALDIILFPAEHSRWKGNRADNKRYYDALDHAETEPPKTGLLAVLKRFRPSRWTERTKSRADHDGASA
ncbi:Wzz/FepE/Etk N-terminal domain-containing protein [Alsobacter sp. KACC 23698]|uniref:Wzz/FepE/Etk N-terminal domain-containing protein n=1 Tax=Alsobacter sp. KACC 23698 TaxID=3149229 RepID=A0AAU7JJB6_9HYPH